MLFIPLITIFLRCSNYCQGRNESYSYFGLSRRHECRCGNRVPGNNHLIADSECYEVCPGDALETCGAHRKTQVYRIINNSTELGCHKYNAQNWLLDNMTHLGSINSPIV